MADFNLDEFLVSAEGACLVIGWVDDRVDAIIEFAVLPYDGGQIDLKPHIRRFQRLDVSKVKQVHSDSFDFGVWASRASSPRGSEHGSGSGSPATGPLSCSSPPP
jgi:hypothetical protein